MPAPYTGPDEWIDRLAEEFVQRYRRGERPSLKEYLDKYPELADDIRTLFPALVEMEQVKEDRDAAAPAAFPSTPLRQIGDYRIVREVGRGGMGVVYEAEQVSLGRRVAVKVLPSSFSADRQTLERFRREARSAAKLHHTNIVPVFEVGQDGDTCFYAMQFIQGQSLDQILGELRRLRGRPSPSGEHLPLDSYTTQVADAPRLALDQLARSLLTGNFRMEPAAADEENVKVTVDPPDALDVSASARGTEATSLAATISSAVLPGQTDLSSVRTDRPHYFQSVARIGWQTANALTYAHARGIVHRDIKPSNLLLDTAGVVWITDFGLAKTQDAALTTTGDIVGTLRYMAPERFQGEGDERGDVYALGLTLYETLVLRPAFSSRDRAELIDRIKNQEPPRPRALDHRIPRDLETIVLKSIHKEAKHRYQTAEAMAEDLRRFLADEPIRAKRTSRLARLRLWGRRHPALATLLLVLMLVAAGATATAFYLRMTLAESEENRRRALQAESKARLGEAVALLGQAHGTRLSRRPGQRFDALNALGKAAAIGRELQLPQEWFDRLRNEAIAALALPDIHITQQIDGFGPGTVSVDLSDDFELYVHSTNKGICTIHRGADNVEIARLPPLGESATATFGPGRLLALRCSSGRFQLWDLSGAEPVLRLQEDSIEGRYFRPDGRFLALARKDGSIHVYDPVTGQLVYRLAAKGIVKVLNPVLHPTEPFVACFSYFHHPFLIRDLRSGTVVASVNPPWPGGNGVGAWSMDGHTVAVPCGDSGVIQQYAFESEAPAFRPLRTSFPLGERVFDVLSPALRPLRTIQGPLNGGAWLSSNPAGDRLVSRGWDGAVHLFDANSGQLLFSTYTLPRASNDYLRFDWTGQRLAAARAGERLERVGLWSVADAREYRSLVLSQHQSTWGEPAIHPSGRLAAQGVHDGVALFDLETGRELAHLSILSKRGKTAGFDGTGSLLINSFGGLFRWSIRQDPTNRDHWIVASPERLPFYRSEKQISASRDGRVIAQCMWTGYGMGEHAGGWILHPNFPFPRRVRAGLSTGCCSVSPDGRWAAFGGGTVNVFDAPTGKCVWQSPAHKPNYCRFSPDCRWLATDGDSGRLYAADTWEPGPQLGPGIPWDISPDSTVAILGQANGIYRLVKLTTGRELARLEDPDQSTGAAVFTPDGAKVVVATKNGLRVWDLRRIRIELAKLGLDWQAPPLPGAGHPPAPLSLHFEVGDLRQWARAVELESQADLYLRKKEHAKALTALRQAVKLAPAYAAAHNNLAWMLLSGPKELRDPEQALREAQKAVESGPHQAEHLHTLGVALYYTGRFADAILILEQSLRAQEGQADAFNLLFLAMCHHRLGAADKAKDCLERGVRWFEQNKGQLPAKWIEEITSFQAEAKSVLAQPPGRAEKRP